MPSTLVEHSRQSRSVAFRCFCSARVGFIIHNMPSVPLDQQQRSSQRYYARCGLPPSPCFARIPRSTEPFVCHHWPAVWRNDHGSWISITAGYVALRKSCPPLEGPPTGSDVLAETESLQGTTLGAGTLGSRTIRKKFVQLNRSEYISWVKSTSHLRCQPQFSNTPQTFSRPLLSFELLLFRSPRPSQKTLPVFFSQHVLLRNPIVRYVGLGHRGTGYPKQHRARLQRRWLRAAQVLLLFRRLGL